MRSLHLAFALAATLASPAPAWAADPAPPPADRSTWTALDYLTEVDAGTREILHGVQTAMVALPALPTVEDADAAIKVMIQSASAAEARMAALPAYRGDASLRDAAVATPRALITMLGGPGRTLGAVVREPRATMETVARAEALAASLHTTAEKVDADYEAAARAFAARHRILLETEQMSVPQNPQAFSLPRVVPAGSHLDATAHLALTVSHYNAHVHDGDAAFALLRHLLQQADPTAFEAARLAAVRQLGASAAQSGTLGPWHGDDGLLRASAALHASLTALADGPAAEISSHRRAPRRTQADVDAHNRAVDALARGLADALVAWQTATTQARDRWGITEFQAFIASQPAATAP
jgi:hypothetical protein